LTGGQEWQSGSRKRSGPSGDFWGQRLAIEGLGGLKRKKNDITTGEQPIEVQGSPKNGKDAKVDRGEWTPKKE